MSYVLFLGFKCTVYKKPPTVRVSLNDIFLDEFSLVHKKSSSEWKKLDVDYWNSNKKYYNSLEFLKPNIKNNTNLYGKDIIKLIDPDILFYAVEINENFWKEDTKLKIEISNLDNNYTNGFMSKNTMITLEYVYMVPTVVLTNPINFCNQFINSLSEIKKLQVDLDSIKSFYKRRMLMYDVYYYNINSNSGLIFFNNVMNKIENYNYREWNGINGYFQFSLIKKHHTIIIDPNVAHIDQILFLFLSYKYNQYANQ